MGVVPFLHVGARFINLANVTHVCRDRSPGFSGRAEVTAEISLVGGEKILIRGSAAEWLVNAIAELAAEFDSLKEPDCEQVADGNGADN